VVDDVGTNTLVSALGSTVVDVVPAGIRPVNVVGVEPGNKAEVSVPIS